MQRTHQLLKVHFDGKVDIDYCFKIRKIDNVKNKFYVLTALFLALFLSVFFVDVISVFK